MRHKRTCYDLNVMRQSAYLVINTITVANFAALFNCTPVDRASDSYDGPDLKLLILVDWDWSSFVCCLVHRGSTDDLLLKISICVVWQTKDLHLSRNMYMLRHRLCFVIVLKRDLFVYRYDSLTS